MKAEKGTMKAKKAFQVMKVGKAADARAVPRTHVQKELQGPVPAANDAGAEWHFVDTRILNSLWVVAWNYNNILRRRLVSSWRIESPLPAPVPRPCPCPCQCPVRDGATPSICQ